MFTVGPVELLMIFLMTGLALWLGRSPERRWLFGVPALFAVSALTTTADPVSQLLIAVPCSVIYATALLLQERHFKRAA